MKDEYIFADIDSLRYRVRRVDIRPPDPPRPTEEGEHPGGRGEKGVGWVYAVVIVLIETFLAAIAR